MGATTLAAKQAIENIKEAFGKIGKTKISVKYSIGESPMPETRFYQTSDARETLAIIEDENSISIGIARAGRIDIENGRVPAEGGMNVAEGRARKARIIQGPLIEKNYLRGIHALYKGNTKSGCTDEGADD